MIRNCHERGVWQLHKNMKEKCLHALTALVIVFATGLLPVSAQNDATNRPPVQTFYLPIPEELANEVR